MRGKSVAVVVLFAALLRPVEALSLRPFPSPESRRSLLGELPFLLLNPLFTTIVHQPCLALTPQEAEADYDSYAADYDALDGGSLASLLNIDQARRDLIHSASGNVLEIGVGTGLNLSYYDASRIKSLTVVDISRKMLDESLKRVASLKNLQGIPIRLVKADATSELVSMFGEAPFDTAVDTFSLCVMGNDGARQCLQQLERVVQPRKGRVLLLENSRSDNPLLGLYQDATADAAAMGGKGCVYNQNVGAMLRESTHLEIVGSKSYAAGLFQSFDCRRR
jgi:methyltransferase OMS1